MKVSLKWLQTYFDMPLPGVEALSDALTFHSFEIEEANEKMIDVNVLPNRAADCLCHRGIAKEISAILDIPFTRDPLRLPLSVPDTKSSALTVEIEDSSKCFRYVGALVKDVKIVPSPDWLREALESIGQRSVNNVVDATNYVMLNIGQPLHAFDAKKLVQEEGGYAIRVRNSIGGEQFTTLSNEAYELQENVLLITDANTGIAIGIAGIKGGKTAEVTEDTTDLVIEAANFDGTTVRRGAQALKLFTDASVRFQNRPSPELCAYGMRDVISLIQEIAGGEVVDIVDTYPTKSENEEVSVTTQKINDVLGSSYTSEEVQGALHRLGLTCSQSNGIFTVTPPFERTDIAIPEDLVEEVGRIIGYEHITAVELPPSSNTPDQALYRGIEKVKDELVALGFTEISTQSFSVQGDIILENPLDKTKPALRKDLHENMKDALVRAVYVAPLVLPPKEKPKLFEIGVVFNKNNETLSVETSEAGFQVPEIQDDSGYVPTQYRLGTYVPFSVYPFVVRDIAIWTPIGTEETHVTDVIRSNAGTLLVRLDQFDRFEKEGKVSFAFRLVFQSMERTLTDEEVNGVMAGISEALSKVGYEVR